MDDLEYKIELIRRELLKTAEEKGLSSNETVMLSVELDDLLNNYSHNQKQGQFKKNSVERKTQIVNEKFG